MYNQYFLLQTTATVSEICSKSEERVASGFSVKVLMRCTGGKDDLYQDIMKVKLQSGSRTLHLVFPVAVRLINSYLLCPFYSCTKEVQFPQLLASCADAPFGSLRHARRGGKRDVMSQKTSTAYSF